MNITKRKLVLAGNICEVYEFSKAFAFGFTLHPTTKSVSPLPYKPQLTALDEATDPEIQDKRMEANKRSAYQAKAHLRRLINANAGQYHDPITGYTFKPVFITYTFQENITDITKANKLFTKFTKRLNYEITKTKESYLKYVVVPEFQKRGAVHFHVLYFNLPKRDYLFSTIRRLWREKQIKIIVINDLHNIGGYLSKYFTKQNGDERLKGKKKYFVSRGLIQPKVIMDETTIDEVMSSLNEKQKVFEQKYKNDYAGDFTYRVYDVTVNNLPKPWYAGNQARQFYLFRRGNP